MSISGIDRKLNRDVTFDNVSIQNSLQLPVKSQVPQVALEGAIVLHEGSVKVSDGSSIKTLAYSVVTPDSATLSAVLGEDQNITADTDTTILFDNVTQSGFDDAYDDETGIFSVPADGVYYIDTCVRINSTGAVENAKIFIRKENTGGATVTEMINGGYTSVDQDIVLQASLTIPLVVGETIFIQILGSDALVVESADSYTRLRITRL